MLTIIRNYYSQASEQESELRKLQTANPNDFKEKWTSVATRDQPLFINKAQLPVVLNRLDESSSLRIFPNDENIQLLGIPIRNEGQFYLGDVLIALNQARLKQMQAEFIMQQSKNA